MTRTELTKEDRERLLEMHAVVSATAVYDSLYDDLASATFESLPALLDQLTAAEQEIARLRGLLEVATETCETQDYDEACCFFCGERPRYTMKDRIVVHDYVHAADCAYVRARAALGEGGT